MFRILLLLLLMLLPAGACIWDRDTWREEAKGRIDTLKAITGWFDRHPPRYYEIRLERVAKELDANPSALDLYDDAGVACNRLGRFDESIEWMARKKAVLDTIPGPAAHLDRYRYHANLGSFLGNRWATRDAAVRNGDLSDLVEATKHIAQAIALNPAAHFGREKYQLKLFQWLQREAEQNHLHRAPKQNFLGLEGADKHIRPGGLRDYPELDDAESGLAGLIHLGSAWESIDVFDALGSLVQIDGASSLAYLAEMRLQELDLAGHGSLHPSESHRRRHHGGYVQGGQPLGEWYKKTRKLAKERETAWLAYQAQRFDRGMHPDTHPDFWEDWKEPQFPELPRSPKTPEQRLVQLLLFALAAMLAAVGVFIGLRWNRAKGKRQAMEFR